ncbi:uncharacterized protein LOC135394061 [Ornithodoros turicata]|uniref:uncharacterized protein LOC135394061 n=1 Tax=Ornithodoros turicata TaxID=34597 RepID=UPI0031386387
MICNMAFLLLGWSLLLLATDARALQAAIGLNSSMVKLGSSLWMNCSYDLEGDTLYAVKWFKDGIEFYRFMPQSDPQQKFFPLRGLESVDRQKTTRGDVFIASARKATQGLYRCEVSADAPTFSTAQAETELTIDARPTVTGLTISRSTLQTMWLNCSYELAPEKEDSFTLSWYKDGVLIYGVTATGRTMGGIQRVPVRPYPGIHIDDQRSSGGNVLLQDVSKNASGTYRCLVNSRPGDLSDAKEMLVTINDDVPPLPSDKQEINSCPEPEDVDVSAKRKGKKIIITLYMPDD